MGLFKKKDNKLPINEYGKSERGRHRGLLTSFDQMEYFVFQERNDEEMFRLCDALLHQKAVLANFDKLNPADCNYMLSFISGVVYSRQGQSIKLGARLFLFAGKEEFEDGSLYQYIEDIK
ncbi:MAG: cell division protein SepF [Bacilli bacterium]|jgi:FtsZ-interacting cell division protein YlmF|nr:cell division protein SepF [Bacilli bacterium]